MKQTRPVLLPLAAAVLCLAAISARALSLRLDPGLTTVAVGQSFDVGLYLTATQPEAVLGWDFDLFYDPAQVAWTGTTLGGLWQSVPSLDGDGLAGLVFPDPIFGTDVLMATLSFRCLGPGSSLLDVGLLSPADPNEGILTVNGLLAQWTSTPGTVVQRAGVPSYDPGTLALLGASCLLLALGRRYWLPRARPGA